MEYTLTYSASVDGWPSFYSYYPDWMVGMNNFFYTFRGGNLYRHNVNETRNTFYADWWVRIGSPSSAFVSTQLQSVLNQAVLENKLFKTINLQGDSPWEVQLETDLQYSGFIQTNWFEKKEEYEKCSEVFSWLKGLEIKEEKTLLIKYLKTLNNRR